MSQSPASAPDRSAPNPRAGLTSSLSTAPILPTLLRLAAPNVLAMVMSVLVGIAETKYVGVLGTAPLAAMAVVFPFAMLVQMMSGGAMGGGVSSAVSRALGAGDLNRARLLAWHALIVGGLAGGVTTGVFLACGPTLFALLGAQGEVLSLAVAYAVVLFSGAWLVWLLNTLASILRGTGDMRVPSATLLSCALLQILIGGSFGLGLGPFPRWGMPGVALGQLVANLVGVLFLAWWLRTGRARFRLEASGFAVRREMFMDILKVGALACLSPTQSVITVLIMTGLIAPLGVAPLAGYGIGQRLEFMLVPIAFGIGVAAVPMVGMAVGAGDIARARRVAWTAGVLSAINLGTLGFLVSIVPGVWSHFFSDDPQVLAFAAQYMRWAGPCFGLFGLGLTLYFASQGSGKILGPVIAASVRLLLVAGVGTWLSARGAEPWQLFALVAAGMAIYGVATATAVRLTRWGPAPARA